MSTGRGRNAELELPESSWRRLRSARASRSLPVWAERGRSALVRLAAWLLPTVAGLLALVTVRSSTPLALLPDAQLFTRAGCQIIEGDVSAPYSNPALQSGPAQTALYCAVSKIAGAGGPEAWFVAATAVGVLGLLVALTALRRRAELAPSPPIVAVACAYIALWTVPTVLTAHSAEVVVPLFWVAAGSLVRRHPVAAGIILGLTVGFELWGLVAFPIVITADTRRHRLLAAAAAGAVAAVLVLPFAIAGHFAMFHFVWPVMPHTLPALIWPAHNNQIVLNFGLGPRVIQLGLAVTACALVARRVRNHAHLLPWAPAMTAEFVRLQVDPTLYTYYWVVPELLSAAALVCATSTRQRLVIGAVAVLQVAGELNEYRLVVVALSLVLVASAVLGPMRTPHLERGAQIKPATT
jgi:hypothetical protein